MGSLIRYNDSVITVQHRGDTRCLLRVESGPVTVQRYDPGSLPSESTSVIRSIRTQALVNNHFYRLSARDSIYLYIDARGDLTRYEDGEDFEEALLNSRPEMGYRPRFSAALGIEVDQSTSKFRTSKPTPEVVRPTRFERLLRESEVWEEYRPPPKPIREIKKEITEAELAEIFDKPKKLISQAPDPMGIDITKLMDEVLKS